MEKSHEAAMSGSFQLAATLSCFLGRLIFSTQNGPFNSAKAQSLE